LSLVLIGYARVSSVHQETRLQLDALKRHGVRKVYQEQLSAIKHRPQLQAALQALQPGDVLVVWKLDRIARSLRHLLEVLEQLERRGAGIRSLSEPIDTATPAGKLMLQVLGAVAEFERSLIRERALHGQAAAYRRGVRWGGTPRVVSKEDGDELVRLRDTGLFPVKMLAEIFGCSVSTVYRETWLRRNPGAAKLKTRNLPILRDYL
jgi:DNA invertase Pin-like site-specific DNA recombinase